MPDELPRGLKVVTALFGLAALLSFVCAALAVITAPVPYTGPPGERHAIPATAVPLGCALLVATVGLYRRRRWGRALTLVILFFTTPWAVIFTVAGVGMTFMRDSGVTAVQGSAIALLFSGVLAVCLGSAYYLTLGPGRRAFRPGSAAERL